jgi:hypothetical protein
MEAQRVLAQFDREMRACPNLQGTDRLEEVDGVVRVVGDHSWIAYSQLDSSTASKVIRDQTDYFRRLGKRVEWKVFGHDRPPNLGELLRAKGYVPDPSETLVVLDLAEPLTFGQEPPGVEVRQVSEPAGLSAALAVSEEAFGPGGVVAGRIRGTALRSHLRAVPRVRGKKTRLRGAVGDAPGTRVR